MTGEIIIKSKEQIANIRKSGKYLTELLTKLQKAAKPGMKLIELEFIAEDFMQKNKVKGAFKHYNGFPANLCLSVNECLVHGIPDNYTLKNGDVLKIDAGVNYQGGISDAAITVVVGGELANPLGHKLAKETKKGLDIAVQQIGPGKKMFGYSHAVYQHIISSGFTVIEKLTGHGVGVKVHERPYIHNHPHHPDVKNITFQAGMVIALEPITAIQSKDFELRKGNDRNLYTKKGDIGAHWEYTVLVTEKGYEILSGVTEDF
ncbi:MAG: type I methionyl aminopeptidase [candidate division SR1 bacterium]|nr:type I methionyl aminopeptidase [candidate division SR1 bacterium]